MSHSISLWTSLGIGMIFGLETKGWELVHVILMPAALPCKDITKCYAILPYVP